MLLLRVFPSQCSVFLCIQFVNFCDRGTRLYSDNEEGRKLKEERKDAEGDPADVAQHVLLSSFIRIRGSFYIEFRCTPECIRGFIANRILNFSVCCIACASAAKQPRCRGDMRPRLTCRVLTWRHQKHLLVKRRDNPQGNPPVLRRLLC